jgi:hypothetical protein
MFHLQQAPRRPPFSDWRAQVERLAERRLGVHVLGIGDNVLLGYYHCGLSPREAADDLTEDL